MKTEKIEIDVVGLHTDTKAYRYIDKQFNAILDGKINLLDMDYYLNRLAQSQAAFAEETAQLGNAALTTQSQLNYYSAQIEAHAKAIVKLNKVLDKLDRVLSQRKLGDFE